MTRGKQARLTGRNGQVWQAYLTGETQDAIAARLGISQARISQILTEVRESIPRPVIEEIVAVERDRIARLYAETMAILAARHPLVSTAKGVIIRDEVTGVPLEDAGPKLAAINTAMRIHERVAKTYGLDVPVQIEATVSREISAAEAEWQQHMDEERSRRRQARALLAEQEAAQSTAPRAAIGAAP